MACILSIYSKVQTEQNVLIWLTLSFFPKRALYTCVHHLCVC